jgi:energy-converting hydrogenase Eha subunit H
MSSGAIVTVSEIFRRRVLYAYGLLAMLAVMALIASQVLPQNMLDLLTLIGLVPIAGAAFLMHIRCPKCTAFIGGAVASRILAGPAKGRLESCPFCGVSFDEPPGAQEK